MNNYLVQIKRINENDKTYVDTQIMTAKETLDWLEYRDWQDYVNYRIRYIDSKTGRLYNCHSLTQIINYETGAHIRVLVKGLPRYDSNGVLVNIIDVTSYQGDH